MSPQGFQIIIETFQTDIGKGPNTGDTDGASNTIKQERHATSTSHIIRLDTRHITHWRLARKKTGCRAWRANNKATETKFRC